MDINEIEKAILGYMISEHRLDSERLTAKLFSLELHKKIFTAARKLKEDGKYPNPINIIAELEDQAESGYIVSLRDGLSFNPYFAEQYFREHVNTLLGESAAKKVLRAIGALPKRPDYRGAFHEIKDLVSNLDIERTDPIGNFSIKNQTSGFADHVNKTRKGDIWGHNIESFPVLTRALMGLREIIVLAAQPKVGKSTFTLQIASDVAKQGAGVLYYDFENGRFNLMARELCRIRPLDYNKDLMSGKGDASELIKAWVEKHNQRYKNFAILTDRGLSIDKIKGHLAQMKQAAGREDVLIVIDSLQKLPIKDLKDRRAAIDTWLRGFEDLKTNDPNLTILLISEVSRDGQKPKESGDIEYTGHFLLRLRKNKEKEKQENLEPPDDGIRKLYLEYARDVEAGIEIRFKVDFSHWKFEEFDGGSTAVPFT